MANIKSAKKRILVNQKKKEQNIMIKSDLKTAIKKVKTLTEEGKKQEAQSALNNVFSKLDNAAQENIIHKNNAANKKAKLSAMVQHGVVAQKSTAASKTKKK